MTRRVHISLLLAGPLVGLLSLALHDQMARATAQQTEFVPQPSDWVPFSARTKRVFEDGTVFVGNFYRGLDGSTRSETGPSLDKITSIGIKNVGLREFYLWSPERGWTRQPMELPPWGWTPIPRSWNSRMTSVPVAIEGFQVIQHTSSGRVRYLAPELNLYSLREVATCEWTEADACGRWVYDIRLETPPQSYFFPPINQPIEDLKEPGGIVRRRGPSQ